MNNAIEEALLAELAEEMANLRASLARLVNTFDSAGLLAPETVDDEDEQSQEECDFDFFWED